MSEVTSLMLAIIDLWTERVGHMTTWNTIWMRTFDISPGVSIPTEDTFSSLFTENVQSHGRIPYPFRALSIFGQVPNIPSWSKHIFLRIYLTETIWCTSWAEFSVREQLLKASQRAENSVVSLCTHLPLSAVVQISMTSMSSCCRKRNAVLRLNTTRL